MVYNRFHNQWKDLPDQTTPSPAGFLQKVEDTFVSMDGRLTTIEAGGSGSGILPSIVDTKGDLIAGIADNAVARVPAGTTDGHVLTRSNAATTGMVWSAPTGGGVTDHGNLTGLGDNDHTQYSLTTHDHTTKADLVSGRVPTNQLGTGTPNSSTFLRGDQTWTAPPGGSVLTTKGDLLTRTTSADTRLPVGGTNNQTLVVDSVETTGLKWDTQLFVNQKLTTANLTGTGYTIPSPHTFQIIDLTLTDIGTITFPLVSNTQFTLILRQDALGGWIPQWGSGVKWPGGTVFVPTQASNAIDILHFVGRIGGFWFNDYRAVNLG